MWPGISLLEHDLCCYSCLFIVSFFHSFSNWLPLGKPMQEAFSMSWTILQFGRKDYENL